MGRRAVSKDTPGSLDVNRQSSYKTLWPSPAWPSDGDRPSVCPSVVAVGSSWFPVRQAAESQSYIRRGTGWQQTCYDCRRFWWGFVCSFKTCTWSVRCTDCTVLCDSSSIAITNRHCPHSRAYLIQSNVIWRAQVVRICPHLKRQLHM